MRSPCNISCPPCFPLPCQLRKNGDFPSESNSSTAPYLNMEHVLLDAECDFEAVFHIRLVLAKQVYPGVQFLDVAILCSSNP